MNNGLHRKACTYLPTFWNFTKAFVDIDTSVIEEIGLRNCHIIETTAPTSQITIINHKILRDRKEDKNDCYLFQFKSDGVVDPTWKKAEEFLTTLH